MKWISVVIICLLSSWSLAGESKLITGNLLSIDKASGNLVVKGGSSPYPVAAGAVIETYHKLSNYIYLIPGMRVSLYSEDGDHVSRILIHGPYSLIRQAETH